MTPRLFEKLRSSKGVLLTGCGGGFDIVSGLPILHWLNSRGIPVVLGNLSFAQLKLMCVSRFGKTGWMINERCVQGGYFPERDLWAWLESRGYRYPFIAFQRSGVSPLSDTYAEIVDRYMLDTILLVDGGTDSLIQGDECLLGTPDEDALSIVAAAQLTRCDTYLACLGFGIDQYHGICHHSFLENASAHLAGDSFLGTVSVERLSPEGAFFLEAVQHLNRQSNHKSIVANSISDAIQGRFGDVHATDETQGSTLFINPLMGMYWFFEARAVAGKMIFAKELSKTNEFHEIEDLIRSAHANADKRDWISLPL